MMEVDVVNLSDERVTEEQDFVQWVKRVSIELEHQCILPRNSENHLTLVFVTEKKMQMLNHKYRRKNYVTDILSFGASDVASDVASDEGASDGVTSDEGASDVGASDGVASDGASDVGVFPHERGKGAEEVSLGEIVLCLPVIYQKQKECHFPKWPYYLILHGMLHLLGYDHEEATKTGVSSGGTESHSSQGDASRGGMKGKSISMEDIQDAIFEKLMKEA